MGRITELKKKFKWNVVAAAFCMTVLSPVLVAWGGFGHERINRAAVLSLPAEMRTFFYNHIDFMVQESTVPDLRKYTLNDKTENPRHFIDLENFAPLDSLPKEFDKVKAKYDEKFLNENGILPWYMETMMEKLTKAFKQKRKTEILFIAADLGHYIGDAHMPLHTSANYDGQLTGQKGIHALWEAHLPEMFGPGYTFKPVEAHYIENVQSEIWSILRASHSLVDTLLLADKQARLDYPSDKIYRTDAEGKTLKSKFNQPVHSDEYSKKYHTTLKGMVERQMSKAITATASFWYTAWVNAGKPDLGSLDAATLTKQNAKQLQDELKLWKTGKLPVMESEKEF
jgi:hypothetical protein